MDDPAVVRRRDRLADPLEDVDEVREVLAARDGVGAPLAQDVAERHSPDLLHRAERRPVLEAPRLVDGDRARVIEARQDDGLFRELFPEQGLPLQLRPEHLHGDLPPELAVERARDDAHPAGAEAVADLVSGDRPARGRGSFPGGADDPSSSGFAIVTSSSSDAFTRPSRGPPVGFVTFASLTPGRGGGYRPEALPVTASPLAGRTKPSGGGRPTRCSKGSGRSSPAATRVSEGSSPKSAL